MIILALKKMHCHQETGFLYYLSKYEFIYRNLYIFVVGVDVTANQEEISDFETFQLEWEPNTASWYIRTMQVSFACTFLLTKQVSITFL
jgi:hypothetical protein